MKRKLTYSSWFTSFLAFIASLFIKLYLKTLKISISIHPEIYDLEPKELLFGFWHGRQFLLLHGAKKFPLTIMTDISWAGDIQTKILQNFGIHVVRGSSKHSPARALMQLKRAITAGYSAGFALDGPRGPVYEAKEGILFLAQKSKRPIIPVTSACQKYWQIPGTWCRYQLPKPFSRCLLRFAQPIWQPSKQEAYSLKDLNCEMNKQTQLSDESMQIR